MIRSKMRLNRDQKKLIEDNYCLVDDFIEKTLEQGKIPQSLIDDFKSEIMWKFCISALKFEKERGFKFSTYAYGNFNYGLRKILSKQENKSRETDLNKKVTEKVEIQYILFDFIGKCGLKDEEVGIIEDRFCKNFTLYEISKKYHFSKQYAKVIVSKILGKIKKKIESEDLNIVDFYK